jgi:3-phenylpropionate/trans-cinnamate dioxygenase ferredoxin reductase subunit
VPALTSSDHVVVVGAGLAGWRFIEALRREGYQGGVTLVGDEPDPPYDRPPLSKTVLVGKWVLEKTILASEERIVAARVTMRLGERVTDLDVARTRVRLGDGTWIDATHVVIATGTRARTLPFRAGARLHTLRRFDDVRRLNAELASLEAGAVIAVIGGGFIGAEAATALHTRGFRVIVLEAAPRPLMTVLGEEVSSWLLALAGNAGVELLVDQAVEDVIEADAGLRIVFADGTALDAAVVIVGVGALANVEWLGGSGLAIDNGVVVDEHMMATERVAAIGDVARFAWPSVTGTELVRIEHWEVANVHASTLARYWVTGDTSATLMVPYFWSDQYGKKIQLLGHPHASDVVALASGSVDESKWLALYSRDGVVTGVVALGNPRGLMLSKVLLEAPTSLEGALASSPWSS